MVLRSAAVCAVLAAAILSSFPLTGADVAFAGPDPEPAPSEFDIRYPGTYRLDPEEQGRIVARVDFENWGGSRSAGLDVCVVLPRGFRDIAVDGRRRDLRVSRGGAKLCWYAGVIRAGERRRATVRATAPAKRGWYTTRVKLIAVKDAAVPGETLSERGEVRVR